MNLISRRPMGREDWAWLMACLVCGFLLSVLFAVPEVLWERSPHYGTEYNSLAVNGKIISESAKRYQYEIPIYTRKITVSTSGETKDIFEAVNRLGRQDVDIRLVYLPPQHLLTWRDFFEASLAISLLLAMATAIFRIVEKSCRRLLGVSEFQNKIVRDPSTRDWKPPSPFLSIYNVAS